MSKRNNRRSAPVGRTGRFQVFAEGVWRNTTTWPFGKKNKKTGEQKLLPRFRVNW